MITDSQKGFSLVELLVVVLVVALLAGLSVPVLQSAMTKAEKTECLSNVKQIGLSMLLYANDHSGRLPLNSSHGGTAHFSVPLGDYLPEKSDIFSCPADPMGEDRVANGSSSYVLNYWTSSVVVDLLRGTSIDHTHLRRFQNPSQVPLLFIGAETNGLDPSNDHTHSNTWNSWFAVANDVEVDRHRVGARSDDRTRGATTIAYADGHAEAVSAADLKGLFAANPNFARPE